MNLPISQSTMPYPPSQNAPEPLLFGSKLCHSLSALSLGLCLAGCGGGEVKAPVSLEAAALLELLDKEHESQDIKSLVELDLGKFRISHAMPESEGMLQIRFTLYGVLTEAKKAQIEEELPKFEKRMRDAVISLVQKSETEQLADPALTYLKTEITAALNRVLQARVLKNVVFSEFSMMRS